MVLELGPLPARDVRDWSRLARRMICELRVDPGDLAGIATEDSLNTWAGLVDQWDTRASEAEADDIAFRWSGDHVDTELAEYLLHTLVITMKADVIHNQLSANDVTLHQPFTMLLVQAFVDGLSAEGSCQLHLVDQVRDSLGVSLDH